MKLSRGTQIVHTLCLTVNVLDFPPIPSANVTLESRESRAIVPAPRSTIYEANKKPYSSFSRNGDISEISERNKLYKYYVYLLILLVGS